MNRREAIALLLVFIIPGLFVVFEAAALDHIVPIFGWVVPWDTISWYAQHYVLIFWAVIVLAAIALTVFILWWRHHVRTRIPR